ncbi:chorismate synthase [Ornithinibacillus xuwenensis]|uniref:Chorismate synthase n=1 Tax=Ornithinibacillus xuwenensis TaxID=3144668 RepID=A0ABU9XL23_9BACI
MILWIKTDTEKKRDDYHKLYEKLQSARDYHDKKVSDAEDAYSRYIRSAPYMSNFKIPTNDFDSKREELNAKLLKYFDYEKNKRNDIVDAASKAYERYEHYKAMAIREEEAERARREKELKELWERLNGRR